MGETRMDRRDFLKKAPYVAGALAALKGCATENAEAQIRPVPMPYFMGRGWYNTNMFRGRFNMAVFNNFPYSLTYGRSGISQVIGYYNAGSFNPVCGMGYAPQLISRGLLPAECNGCNSRNQQEEAGIGEKEAQDIIMGKFDDWEKRIGLPSDTKMFFFNYHDDESDKEFDFFVKKMSVDDRIVQPIAVDVVTYGKLKGDVLGKKIDKKELEGREKAFKDKGIHYRAFLVDKRTSAEDVETWFSARIEPLLQPYLQIGAHKPYVYVIEDSGDAGSVFRKKK